MRYEKGKQGTTSGGWNRRTFLRGLPGAALAAGLAGSSMGNPGEAAQNPRSRPNIVFIFADDLGYGNLGCYGQKRIKTPNLDRMAAEGMRFTQAYAAATVCAPSRCGLMTGKHTGHATVRGNAWPELGLRKDESTVAQLLQRAGYRTALIGKWGLGGYDVDSHPNDRGFDRFYGFLNQVFAHNSFPEHIWDNKTETYLKGNWFNQRKQFANDLFTEKALEFVDQQDGSLPFYLYLSYTTPHANNERGQIDPNGMDSPDFGDYAKEDWPDAEKAFAAITSRMDADVGKMLAKLEEKGFGKNTLVFFTSDNGPHREGHHDPDFFDDNGPLRGIKRDVYEGGIRVPMIARWPGVVAAGKESNFVWAGWDFLPTAAELAGAPVPNDVDGISIASVLKGTGTVPSRDYLYWEFHERGFHQAIRQGDWKLVRQGPSFQVELYDLKNDIGETRNLVAEKPDVVKQLLPLFRQARTENPNFPTNREVPRVAH